MRLQSRSTWSVLVLVVVLALAGCTTTAPNVESGAPVEDSLTTNATATNATGNATTAESTVNGTLEVHFINVGQSTSVLVVGPTGETMLYDTGHYRDDGEHVLAYLREHDVERIDHLVVSHNDADHIGGNAAVIDYYESEANGIGAIYDPGIAASTATYSEYLDAVEEHDVTLYETREGDTIRLDGVNVSVLGPPEQYLEDGARNENSIVLELAYGRTSFLLTGDAEDDQESYLVDRYGDRLRATVLKAGHHGSSSSTGGELLDAVKPEAVVVSSAYDSQYEHPTEAVLDRLSSRLIPTYWTATHGNVVFVSDGEQVSVRTQQAAPVAPGSLRDADPVAPGTGGDVVERTRLCGCVETQRTTTAVPDGGTTADGGTPSDDALSLVAVNADAPGDDRENLNGETVVFENTGETTLDLSGWTVADAAGHTYTVPEGTTLAPGERLSLHTGSGTDDDADGTTELYWGSGSPVWNNGGDTVVVRNAQGEIVLEVQYE